MPPNNTTIPTKETLTHIAQKHYPTGSRLDVQRGTNCTWEKLHFIKNGKSRTLYVKKSYLKWDIRKFEEEYQILKAHFKNLIPNQWFIWYDWGIFAFCSPIDIKIDILDRKNRNYLIGIVSQNEKLLKQLKFFVKKYQELLHQGKPLDLWGSENLVISDDDKLYYIDSFLVFYENDTLRQISRENFIYLQEIITIIENNQK